MDGLLVLVVAIGALLLALVAYLGAVDYIDPVPPHLGTEHLVQRLSLGILA